MKSSGLRFPQVLTDWEGSALTPEMYALLGALPGEVLRVRADGRCFVLKPAGGEPSGWAPSGWLWTGETEGDSSQEAPALFRRHVHQAIATRATQTFELEQGFGSEARHYEARVAATGTEEVLVLLQDLTESRLADQKLREARRMEAIGRLSFGIAHDFNNLLTIVLGNAELVLAGLSQDEPARPKIEEIRDTAERAALVTRQLLALGREPIVKLNPTDLNDLVQGMESLLHRLIGEDITLRTSLDASIGSIQADAAQIEQVLLNLAINARDAMPKGGTLVFETKGVAIGDLGESPELEMPPGDYVLLAVSDTGIGMDRETRARAFEPFFTTKERGTGTGLGLATVHGVVTESGGYIGLYSEPGMGTTFHMYFPRAESDRFACEQAPPQPRALSRGETVLLIEDDRQVLDVARQFLEEAGYRVIPVSRCEEALRAAGQWGNAIDVVATDVVMPGMSGLDLAEELRRSCPGLKTLYVSGHTEDAIARHGPLGSGAVFLQKPFGRGELLAAVRRALDGAAAP
jgi:signal transduction histidine kinase/ActR/RegA family two-component response regulator